MIFCEFGKTDGGAKTAQKGHSNPISGVVARFAPSAYRMHGLSPQNTLLRASRNFCFANPLIALPPFWRRNPIDDLQIPAVREGRRSRRPACRPSA
jgi:hypothetical protein